MFQANWWQTPASPWDSNTNVCTSQRVNMPGHRHIPPGTSLESRYFSYRHHQGQVQNKRQCFCFFNYKPRKIPRDGWNERENFIAASGILKIYRTTKAENIVGLKPMFPSICKKPCRCRNADPHRSESRSSTSGKNPTRSSEYGHSTLLI